ncbi:MAG: hypothetical protein ABIL09_03205 [Gemmatimonadota bacterium]
MAPDPDSRDTQACPPHPGLPELDAELRDQVLALLTERLNAGEILITADQFEAAMRESCTALSGSAPSGPVLAGLKGALQSVNAADPGVFLVPGIENWISRSVLAEVRKLRWGIVEVQEQGNQAVRGFLRSPRAAALLGQLGVTPNQLNLRRCLRSVVNAVAGKDDGVKRRSAERLAQLQAARQQVAATAGKMGTTVDTRDLVELTSGPVPPPTEAEAAERTESEARAQARIRKTQLAQLMANLDTYVQMGKLAAEDAERLRKLDQVDRAVRSGKATQEQGSKVRNSILNGKARDRVERQVREAVDYAVLYIQLFQALGRVGARFDPALRFLVRHKLEVNADRDRDGQGPDLRPLSTALIEDLEALRLLIDMMDRKDAEVRMIAAHLPPYSQVLRRNQERIENLVVEEGFVSDLRQLSAEEVSARLNSPDRRVRSRGAADMICLTALINRITKPTPFRKELRLLKLNLIIEEFYRGSDDLENARARAQEFLRTRLRSLYPDLSEEETAEIERRGEEIIQAAEQRVLAERQARGQGAGTPSRAAAGADEAEGDTGLSEEEVRQGVEIHRVGMRVAGRLRQVPLKVMPDPEDGSRFIIVRRDPESGEMVPLLRRGAKRYVQEARDGSWEAERD